MRKLIAFDDDTLDKLTQLGRDRMATFQELADEAFADVLNKHAAFGEYSSQQQSAMAAGRILFRAKYGNNGLVQTLFKTRQTRLKGAGLSYFAVQHTAINIVVGISTRPTSKLAAQIYILEAGRASLYMHRLA